MRFAMICHGQSMQDHSRSVETPLKLPTNTLREWNLGELKNNVSAIYPQQWMRFRHNLAVST